jgi:ubiquinone biosynthesis protein UbiJ
MVVTKQKKGITVSGDVDLANIFSKIMLKARWDYEEDLSYVVGDIAAVEITKITRAFARDGKKSLQSVAENFVEYWQEEKQILITKAEVDKFNSGVDEIQESFSRVEAKINELLQNKSQ